MAIRRPEGLRSRDPSRLRPTGRHRQLSPSPHEFYTVGLHDDAQVVRGPPQPRSVATIKSFPSPHEFYTVGLHDDAQVVRGPPQPRSVATICRPTGRHRQLSPFPQAEPSAPRRDRGVERWGLSARSSDRTRWRACSARRPAPHERGSADRMLEHGQPPSRSPAPLHESFPRPLPPSRSPAPPHESFSRLLARPRRA